MDIDIDASGWAYIEQLAADALDQVVHEVYEDAYRNAPEKSGELKRSLDEQHEPGALVGYVTVGIESEADHWAAVEYGSAPHQITTNSKQVLSDGNKVYGKRVNHPGNAPDPFMRSALLKQRELREQG